MGAAFSKRDPFVNPDGTRGTNPGGAGNGVHGQDYKVAVLGVGGVGKSAICIQFTTSHFVEDYDPTIEDSYRKQITVDNQVADLEVLDTAGQEDFVSLQSQWIQDNEGFIIVFAVDSKQSYEQVAAIYERILRTKDAQKQPCVLVGNKTDLEREVSEAEGHALAAKLGGCPYLETSAKKNMGIPSVFEAAVKQCRLYTR